MMLPPLAQEMTFATLQPFLKDLSIIAESIWRDRLQGQTVQATFEGMGIETN
jgi:hypothetical protein